MDMLIIGAGLTGAVLARQLAENHNKKVVIWERRNHIGGNMYDYKDEYNILVQKYGPHTFHTKEKYLYDYMCKYGQWKNYKLKCMAVIDGKATPTPFNYKTIDDFYSQEEAADLKSRIEKEYSGRKTATVLEVLNSKDEKIRQYAEFLYEKDYKLYTAKQWGIPADKIDKSVLERVPLRFSYDEGYFDDEPNSQMPSQCQYLGRPEDVQSYLKAHPYIHYLFCCLPSRRSNIIVPIINYCENNLVHFFNVPNLHNYLHNRVYFNMIGNVPYLSLRTDPLSYPENKFLKRAFDIVFSLLFLCTLFPIILIIVTIITKLTMPGPIFFRQKRNGLNDKEFYCYKFRSMKVNAEADTLQATKDDPRKTRWGNIMRKTNIDELPQFINVLLGNMSVVGPRPHMLKHTEEYSKLINKYMVRHFVKPGITGWSQVTGYRGETKELKDMEGRVIGDIWYIEHWSFWLDIYIIYKTVRNAIHGEKNAY